MLGRDEQLFIVQHVCWRRDSNCSTTPLAPLLFLHNTWYEGGQKVIL